MSATSSRPFPTEILYMMKYQYISHCACTSENNNQMELTHLCLAPHKRDNVKQCRPRSYAAERCTPNNFYVCLYTNGQDFLWYAYRVTWSRASIFFFFFFFFFFAKPDLWMSYSWVWSKSSLIHNAKARKGPYKWQANNDCSDQSAHPRRLIRTFSAR